MKDAENFSNSPVHQHDIIVMPASIDILAGDLRTFNLFATWRHDFSGTCVKLILACDGKSGNGSGETGISGDLQFLLGQSPDAVGLLLHLKVCAVNV